MRIKKLISLGLAASMALAFTACGEKPAAEGSSTSAEGSENNAAKKRRNNYYIKHKKRFGKVL